MQWVAKAVQYYKDINPATLTGAIDVIVVERPTESGDVELACSPFHVRFGKLSVLRPIDKKVRITVNDQSIPFYMKVGETGEAFFVFETDADLPEDMQTSPLAGPMGDDEIEQIDEGATGEPEFLDLGASQTTEIDGETQSGHKPRSSISSITSSSPGASSRYASMDQTHVNSPDVPLRDLPSYSAASAGHHDDDDAEDRTMQYQPPLSPSKPSSSSQSALLSAAANVALLGRTAITSLSSNKKLHDLVESATSTAQDVESSTDRPFGRSSQEVGELERRMHEEMDQLDLGDPSERPGSEVRRTAWEQDADVRRVLKGKTAGVGRMASIDGNLRGDGTISSRTSLDIASGMAGDAGSAAPERNGDLMLDMSGYKIDDDDVEQSAHATQHILEDEVGISSGIHESMDDRAEKEMVDFTQGLLRSADPKTLKAFFGPSDDDLDSPRPTSPTPMEEDDIAARSKATELDLEAGMFQGSPKQFSIRIGGKLHVFELSLGGASDFGIDPLRDHQSFIDHQVTFSQFIEHDDITDHSNLVVKYGGRYLTWQNASPVLASLAVYRKSLVDHPEHHRNLDPSASSKRLSSSKGWGLWWSRKGGAAALTASLPLPGVESSPPTSPPITRPPSPRSLPTSPGGIELPIDDPILNSAPPSQPHEADTRHYAKTLRLTSDQLKTLGLKKGKNVISFSVRSSYSGYATCTSRIFLWESDYQVVISDIDGTITKSDALGHVFTMIGRDWTHIGVAKLYTDIARNGYKMMYLTSRAIGQADTTREYLKGIKQNGYVLPEGPVIMSPDRLMTSLHREVIMRKPEVFKMACLRDIQRLFSERSPFYSGFGNRITDALSYRSVDIPSSRIFTIDTNGEVKMELLELAGYKSSYLHMTDLVDQMFPPINRKTAPDYTDFNFWRAPVAHFDLPDLTPPSPALSARSDSSRLGLSRLGNIASSLSRRSSRAGLTDRPALPGAGASKSRSSRAGTPSSPLLQATLVEEYDGGNGDAGQDDDDEEGGRSESESMPGSLPNASDFEKYRAAVERSHRRNPQSDLDLEKERTEYDDEQDGDGRTQREEEGDDFGEEMDFTSVPYL